jgi:hypothetical protein
MAGLVPAIHVFGSKKEYVDARDKRGHDERECNLSRKKAPVETGA